MNTVGKKDRLGESIRCVVSVSMLTEGWDANTVTHVLGVRAFGTQLLCEQVIGRACAASPTTSTRRTCSTSNTPTSSASPSTSPPSRSSHRRSRRARRSRSRPSARSATHCEIRFPRVEGYRVELPEERLTAEFNDDSILELTPDLVGPSITRNQGIIGEGVDLNLDPHRRPAPLHAPVPPHQAPALHQVARPRRRAQAPPLRPAQADHQAVARQLPGLQGRHLSRPSSCTRSWPTWPASGSRAASPARSSARRPIKAVLDPYNPTGSTHARQLQHLQDRPLGDRRHDAATSTGSISTATGRPSSAVSPRPTRRCGPTSRTTTSASRCPTATAPRSRRYLPDFIVLVDDGHGDDDLLHLVVEIKGYRREDAKEKKATMDTYWVPGVNNLGTTAAGPSPSSPRSTRSRPTSRPRSKPSSIEDDRRRRPAQADDVRESRHGEEDQAEEASRSRRSRTRRRRGRTSRPPSTSPSCTRRSRLRSRSPTSAATATSTPARLAGKDEQDWPTWSSTRRRSTSRRRSTPRC